MSRMNWVASLEKTLTPPLVPAGVMVALALTRPSELSVETVGWVSPAGQMVRYPSDALGTTVALSE